MNRLLLTIVGLLIILPIVAAGCTAKEPAGLTPGEEEVAVRSCVACHTDKDLLKEVATPEPEDAHSEATSGEG